MADWAHDEALALYEAHWDTLRANETIDAIAAALRVAYVQGHAAERERCAGLVDQYVSGGERATLTRRIRDGG